MRVRQFAGVAAALLAALLMLWAVVANKATLPDPVRLVATGPVAAARPAAKASATASDPAPRPSPAAKPDRSPMDWAAGFSDPEIYARAIKLREARRPGSFLEAYGLMQACRAAMGAAFSGELLGAEHDLLTPAVGTPSYAQRLHAKNLIVQRCQSFVQHKGFEKPLQDDPYGQAAQAAMTGQFSESLATRREVASVLAKQGHLHQAAGMAALTYWNGESMKADFGLYQEAFMLARLQATAAPDAGKDDVRLLETCLRTGRCGLDYTATQLANRADLSPERRAKIEALAAEMSQALRAGDFQKFLP